MPTESQNGWIIPPTRMRNWTVPGTHAVIPLRDGAVGFVLIHLALWFSERIETLDDGIRDDWGYARTDSMSDSNHLSATAMDLNATKHPFGLRGTFKAAWQYVRIRARLAWMRNVIRWGGDYHIRADEMHFEINSTVAAVESLAQRLVLTNRGRRILTANGLTAAGVIRA